jgi:hypothetical protein
MRSWGWLVAGGVGLWVVALYPGLLLGGELAMLQSAVALLLCLVTSMGTFWWAMHAGTTPEKQLLATLGGSGVRMLAVLGAGLVLRLAWPEVFNDYFWIWIAIFYLFLLAVETMLLVRNKQNATL